MSAKYEARMEILLRKREELTAQRQAIEKRMALCEATAAEYSSVAVQISKKKGKAQHSSAISAKKRNEDFVRALHDTQKQMHHTWSRLQSDQLKSSALLAQEKTRYNCRVEQIFPAWQEQLQRQRVQKLKELENKKRAVERRRNLAEKSFEREQKMDDLIQKTRHEVELAENLEHNKHCERELLRSQSINQATEGDKNIRDVAAEARSILQQHAIRHVGATPEEIEELADKLYETFSPKNTFRAGSSFHAFEEKLSYEDNSSPRQTELEIPTSARLYTSDRVRANYVCVEQEISKLGSMGDEYFENDLEKSAYSFDDRPALHNSADTGIGSCAEKNYFDSEQSNSLHQVPDSKCNNLIWAVAANSAGYNGLLDDADADSKYSNICQQSSISHKDFFYDATHDEETSQPCEKSIMLPTLVTDTLFSISEVNEPISSNRTCFMGSDHDKADLAHDTPFALVAANEIITKTAKLFSDTANSLPTTDDSYTEKAKEEAPRSSPSPVMYIADFSKPISPTATTLVTTQCTEENIMQSCDFDSPASFAQFNTINPSNNHKSVGDDTKFVVCSIEGQESYFEPPSVTKTEKHAYVSTTEKFSPVDRIKALESLISRVEEGAIEGDTLGERRHTGIPNESKRELMRMAVGGRKEQIAFFGSMELILDILRDLGPELQPFFQKKSFEGEMNDQKLHQSNQASNSTFGKHCRVILSTLWS